MRTSCWVFSCMMRTGGLVPRIQSSLETREQVVLKLLILKLAVENTSFQL